jgi:Peptidase family M23
VARLSRIVLLSCLIAASALPGTPALASDGGTEALDLPFIGPVRPAGSGGATAVGTGSGGTAVGDRAPATRRGRSLRPRRHGRRRVLRKRGKRRRVRHTHGSGGAAPTPLQAPTPTPTPTPAPDERGHRFPVAGGFDLGGSGSRFGAPRAGHTHQGHDIAAAEGTPVVAPWAGRVEFVRFQQSGAGWYVVLDGDGEDRDYVFMHLRTGSIRVSAGQHVSTGARLADAGNTGASTGPHLHFEVWEGGWYENGGRPVDPLPLLRAWLVD